MSDTSRLRVKPEDLNELRFLGEVQLSPDGTQVYYDVFYVNQEKNIYQGEIWQTDTATGKAHQLTSGGSRRDSGPRLSPDGKKLAFLSDRPEDHKKQVFLLEVDRPGEARQLTAFQNGISGLVWSSDSRHLAILAETPDDSAKAALSSRPESNEARRERETREQEEKRIGGNPVTYDRFKVRADGRRSLVPGDAHTQIWLLDTTRPEAEARQLTNGAFGVGQAAFSPDGQRLVFSSTRDRAQADFTCISDLWLIQPFSDNLEMTKLTASRGPATFPAWSPDSQQIAFIGHTNPKDGSFLEIPRVWVLDITGQNVASEPRCLTADFDYMVTNLVGSDMRASSEMPLAWDSDGQIYFVATHGSSTQIFAVAAQGNRTPQAITAPGRHLYAYSMTAQAGKIAFGAADPACPGDVFIQPLVAPTKDKESQRLTNLNRAWLDNRYISPAETIHLPSTDGMVEIEGWLLKPPGFDPSKKYPLLLEIHGGPHTAYGDSFYHEFQILASQGYVVLYTNPRGSVGYGYEFGAAIYNDWGHHDYDDVMAAVDYVIAQGYIDPARLGVTGGSYGGYMTNWIICHTDRFKAALTQRCVSNLVSMYTLSDIAVTFNESEFEGDIWTNPRFWERSPMAHANKARTPLLMLHSEADYRCPIEQAEEFFFALKRVGCPVELIRTPGEDHNLSRSGSPDHRLGRLRRIAGWFEKHLGKAD